MCRSGACGANGAACCVGRSTCARCWRRCCCVCGCCGVLAPAAARGGERVGSFVASNARYVVCCAITPVKVAQGSELTYSQCAAAAGGHWRGAWIDAQRCLQQQPLRAKRPQRMLRGLCATLGMGFRGEHWLVLPRGPKGGETLECQEPCQCARPAQYEGNRYATAITTRPL